MIKYSKSSNIITIIKYIFEGVINDMVVPQALNIGVLKPITKDVKGSTADVEGNTRPITISDVIGSIWERFIKIRLKDMKTSDKQFGFKEGAGRAHAVYIQKENI